ncbi:MAG: hypothetical protein K2G28_07340 [Acetatifactor sp.]|nr:hypothetical protein [Acetatifactor sp.]MDE7354344.1 hypothetical protein [Acetatifactor sp.]
MEAASSSINEAVSETEKYIADHHEEIESYLAYKRSEEYETTPAGRLEKELCRFKVNLIENTMKDYRQQMKCFYKNIRSRNNIRTKELIMLISALAALALSVMASVKIFNGKEL